MSEPKICLKIGPDWGNKMLAMEKVLQATQVGYQVYQQISPELRPWLELISVDLNGTKWMDEYRLVFMIPAYGKITIRATLSKGDNRLVIWLNEEHGSYCIIELKPGVAEVDRLTYGLRQGIERVINSVVVPTLNGYQTQITSLVTQISVPSAAV